MSSHTMANVPGAKSQANITLGKGEMRFRFFSWILALVFLSASPFVAFAAEYSISPATASFGVNGEFTVKVMVDPAGANINAVDGTLTFDKDVVTVSRVSKEGSSFSLWTADPKFSNTDGTVVFSGGSPTPLEGKGTVLSIVFKGKKEGTAAISFSAGSILAADGQGTNVYTGVQPATLTVTAGKQDTAAPVAEDVSDVGSPSPAATVNSSTHAKSDAWYATTTAEFSWTVPDDDATSFRYEFSKDETSRLTKTLSGTEKSISIDSVGEGVMFFLLQYRNDFGWSELAVRKIQTDLTPPKQFDFLVAEDSEKPSLQFEAVDELSGISRYEILFGGSVVLTIKDQDVTKGSYPIPAQSGGPTKVAIKAYDKAGNVTEVEREVNLPLVEKPSTSSSDAEALPPQPTWTMERIMMVIFAFGMGALTSWHIYSRKIVEKERLAILQDVLALREKNDKIFQAMREEFEQMISDFDDRPQLTPEERDLVEKVKEILDISSELVDSGIEDLKKTVRGKG